MRSAVAWLTDQAREIRTLARLAVGAVKDEP